jgi:hypothetical protein
MTAARITTFVVLMILATGSSPIVAEEPETGGPESRHEVTLFAGVTDDDQEVAFTLGADYEYHFTQLLGIGALVDFAFGDLRSKVFGVPVFFHPTEPWKVILAPGFETREGDNNFLVRIGGGYSFDL